MRLAQLVGIVILIFSVFQSQASNRLYADNTLEPTEGFAWDWSITGGYYIDKHNVSGIDYVDGLELFVNLALSYNDFYFDVDNSQLTGGLTLGYNLVDRYGWGFDIVAVNMQEGFDEYGTYYNEDDRIAELAGIRPRDPDFNAGLRLSRSFDNTQLSFELLQDISSSHNGIVANGFVSTIRDYRNWEFRLGGGYNIFSSEFTNYYYGINANEVRENRPYYNPGSSFSVNLEVHAEYPINEHWVFLSGLLATWMSSEIVNSPIVDSNHKMKAKIGVRYVF